MAISDGLRKLLGKERIDQMKQYEPIKPKYRNSHEAIELPIASNQWLDAFARMYKQQNEVSFIWSNQYEEIVMRFNCKEMKRGVTLLGNPGTGKTSVLCTLSALLRYTTSEAFDLYNTNVLQRCYNKEGEAGIENAYRKYALIDDIGAEPEAIHYGSRINVSQRLIEGRYNSGLVTHYTSNLMPDELCDLIGDRAFSRLRGKTQLYIIKGEDKR